MSSTHHSGSASNTNVSGTDRRSKVHNDTGAEIRTEHPVDTSSTNINNQQTTQHTSNVSEQTSHSKQHQDFKPFHYSFNYSSSSVNKGGKQEMKERFEMKHPELDLVAERKPGAEDLYDVHIEKKKEGSDAKDKEVINQQLPASQLRNQIDNYWKDMSNKMEDSFNTLGLDLPIKPLLGIESFGLPEITTGLGLPSITSGLLGSQPPQQQAIEQQHGTVQQQQPQQQQQIAQQQQQAPQQQQGQLQTHQPYGSSNEGTLGLFDRRRDYFREPFRAFEEFDRDFRMIEDEMRRMRDSMFRSFRDFDRRWNW